MITITKNRKKILLTTTLALILSACGGSSNSTTIDVEDENKSENRNENNSVEVSYKSINKCDNNSTSAIDAKATLVPFNTTVRKNEKGTVLRVWHFQNSEELVCVVKGSAEIIPNP